MQEIVRQAGELALQYHGSLNESDVDYKSEADLVTKADREIENYIFSELSKIAPGVDYLGEESFAQLDDEAESETDLLAGKVFILDPIDGTTNFVHGVPFFCISLAYYENSKAELAVVYAPALKYMYTARRGYGAFCNGRPIGVSKARELGQCLAVTGFINLRSRIQPDNIAEFSRFGYQVRSVLRLGSAALDLCFVAHGRVDFFWEMGLHVWDIAAGVLIAQEAGGVITDMTGGGEYLVGQQGILAANPCVHQAALNVLLDDGLDFAADPEIAACLFDFDGVITDSFAMHTEGWRQAFDAVLACPLPELPYEELSGITAMQLAQRLCKAAGHEDRAEDVLAFKIELMANGTLVPPLRPGVRQVFGWCRCAGIPFGIASNAPISYVRAIVDHHGLDVDVVLGYEDVENPKPAPDPYLLCAEKLGIDRSENKRVLVFEDSPTGLGAAVSAGMIPVGIEAKVPAAILEKCGASAVYADLSDWFLTAATGCRRK
mgnify:CR=1 FL=1